MNSENTQFYYLQNAYREIHDWNQNSATGACDVYQYPVLVNFASAFVVKKILIFLEHNCKIVN